MDETIAYYREQKIGFVEVHRRRRDADGPPAHPERGDRRGGAEEQRHHDRLRHRSIRTRARWARARRGKLVEEYGVKGFKFHPTVQGFEPDRPDGLADLRGDRRAQAAGRSSTAATRASAAACAAAAACGCRTRTRCCSRTWRSPSPTCRSSSPIRRWPWQDEAISLAMHKPNVWIDLSGWSPKYFPPQLVQYANTLLKDRDPVRQRLPADHARPLAEGLRGGRLQGRGASR